MTPVTLSALVDDYLRLTPALRGYSPATLNTYKSWLNGFVKWAGEDATALRLTPDDLLAYQVYRLDERQGLRPRSLNTMRSAFLSFCSWLVERRLLLDNPARCIPKVREDAARRRIVTDDDLPAILAACELFPVKRRGQLAHAALSLLSFSAVRKSELLALKVGDINLPIAIVTVHQGKGGKDREIPICSRCVEAMRQYLVIRGESELSNLLLLTHDRPLRSGVLLSLINEALALAGLADKQYNPHAFRHWYATTALNEGANPGAVADNMGHSGTGTLFKIYNHPNAEQRRKVANLVSI